MASQIVPAERAGALRLSLEEDFSFQFGGVLDRLEIDFETWGELNSDRLNAILICPAFSAHSHARSSQENPEPGWWQEMIGPGRAFDTDRYHVICSSLLGGGSGTTGPLSINQQTGQEYAGDFPLVSIRDIVRVQVRLLHFLGIERLYAAVGGSMGGMEVLELLTRDSPACDRGLVLSATARTQSYTATIRHVGRRAIMLDPAFKGGFYGENSPRQGLKLAREIGTMYYRSRENFNSRFSCTPIATPSLEGITFDFQSYLDHMGNKILSTFDANAYLRLSMAMDLHDVSRDFDSLDQALRRIQGSVMVMGVEQDPLIPIDEQRDLYAALEKAGVSAQWHSSSSPFGHDTFLKEFDWLTPRVQRFLEP